MRIKSLKMVFVARIIRHKLCIIYAFFDFFCSKIIFDQKLFSYCLEKFDYPGSIVYLSCSALRNQSFWEHCKRSPIITSARVFWKNLNGGLIRESDRYPHFLGVYEQKFVKFSLDILVLRRERGIRDHFCMFGSYENIFYL